MIQITPTIAIREGDLRFEFMRAPGPGGQNVNKVASAVRLHFALQTCPALDENMRARLRRIAGRRLGPDGVLIIEARRFRTQGANRQDAIARLMRLLRAAAEPPPVRHPTEVPRASRRRRLEGKKRRGQLKRTRRLPGAEPED